MTAKGPLEEIQEVLKAREPVYREMATVTLCTDEQSVEELADEIVRQLRLSPSPETKRG